jgi:hypothetical protein
MVTIRTPYARSEVFTAVKIQDEFFWVLTPCSVVVGYLPEDEGSMDLLKEPPVRIE